MLLRALLAATLVLPLAAQTPGLVPATVTKPPVGFTQAIVLFPGGAPGALRTGPAATEGDIPKLFTYPAPGAGPHPAVIVFPGGGYTHVVVDKEGSAEAKWLNERGVSAFVLEYRLSPAYMFPAPMQDASQAIRYVRAHAAELGVDPGKLGIWGFSAGGHLAGYFATIHKPGDPNATDPLERFSNRPDFAILSYARLTLDRDVPTSLSATGMGPMATLIGDHPAQAVVDSIDPLKHVSADTSPCFIYSTGGDKAVDPLNAAIFYEALKRAGVPVELHIFERGPHGTGIADMQAQHLAPELRELSFWPTLLANWMQQNGWMPMQPEQESAK
jgi:acetyl esterase/lipase